MAWIEIIDEEDAEGDLDEVYSRVVKERGKVSNIMRVQSLNPGAMEHHLDLYMSIMFSDTGLKRADRELLATVVSAANGCEYCVKHHSEALDSYWKDEKRMESVLEDFKSADLPERTIGMLEYGYKLTREPENMERSDVERLRDLGFSDRNILNINLIVSYFNFVNRISSGLGNEFTPEEASGYRY